MNGSTTLGSRIQRPKRSASRTVGPMHTLTHLLTHLLTRSLTDRLTHFLTALLTVFVSASSPRATGCSTKQMRTAFPRRARIARQDLRVHGASIELVHHFRREVLVADLILHAAGLGVDEGEEPVASRPAGQAVLHVVVEH